MSQDQMTAFDSASEEGNSFNEYHREHKHSITMTNNGPPVPPRSKPPTPPPYNTAVKRGISPVQGVENGPKCEGLCSCPYCPVKNGIPMDYYSAMMVSLTNDLMFCPVSKQAREDFGINSSASNSPRNSGLFRCDSKYTTF